MPMVLPNSKTNSGIKQKTCFAVTTGIVKVSLEISDSKVSLEISDSKLFLEISDSKVSLEISDSKEYCCDFLKISYS